MEVLTLYNRYSLKWRKTIADHLYALERAYPNHTYYYYNCNYFSRLPKSILDHRFDVVVFHYSFLSMRYNQEAWNQFNRRNGDSISFLTGAKIAIPQDEYNYTDSLEEFLVSNKVDLVCTCANGKDVQVLYPRLFGQTQFMTVLTGYVSEDDIKTSVNLSKKVCRDIDIGYRARKLSYALGRHAQKKTEIAEVFSDALKGKNLVVDISTTDDDRKAFLGNAWIKFLMRCRVMLGCLGGASLVDRDGSLIREVNEYMKSHPAADFDEVESAIFPGRDGEIRLFALSPRHFECAVTRTCQVLLEDDYQGVFVAGKNCLILKENYSNIEEIIECVLNEDYCSRLAEQCYTDLVVSGVYSYSSYAERIFEKIHTLPPLKTVAGRLERPHNWQHFRIKIACLCSAVLILRFELAKLRKFPVRAISAIIPRRLKVKLKKNKFTNSIIRKL